MSKARAVSFANDPAKCRNPEPIRGQTWRAFRRLDIRQRAAGAKVGARSEAKLEARHKRAVVGREKTKALAAERVKACQCYLSPHAVEQLAVIAGNAAVSPIIRVQAADALLRIGFGEPSTCA